MGLYTPDENLNEKLPSAELHRLSKEIGIPVECENFSHYLDSQDPLAFLQEEFRFPKIKRDDEGQLCDSGERSVYLCGNSLGLQPKKCMPEMSKIIDQLSSTKGLKGVSGANDGIDECTLGTMATIVGANVDEITMMYALTVNLHLLLVSFYRPTSQRHKILIEAKAFPSDHYLVESQIRYQGFSPETSLVTMKPRPGEELLRLEDITEYIEKEGDSIAVVLFPGVQYYTGQLFDMEAITKVAHGKGCCVGFDLAHAVGNVELRLHAWGVDFAAWCTYKYLNSGPGSIGGAFIHEKHATNTLSKFLGSESWKRNDPVLYPIVRDYAVPPQCPLLLSNLRCSMEIFSKTSINELRNKSFYLTGYLEYLLYHHFAAADADQATVSTITSNKFKERGAQLSLVFSVPVDQIHRELGKRGVICDVRKPDVIRIAPVPIYCTFHDVYRFVTILKESVERCRTAVKPL